jgi:hypothetical protein
MLTFLRQRLAVPPQQWTWAEACGVYLTAGVSGGHGQSVGLGGREPVAEGDGNALKAGFHRMAHLVLPVPVGSRDGRSWHLPAICERRFRRTQMRTPSPAW